MEAEPSQVPVSLNQPALVQLSLAKSPSNLVIGENEDLSGPSPLVMLTPDEYPVLEQASLVLHKLINFADMYDPGQ